MPIPFCPINETLALEFQTLYGFFVWLPDRTPVLGRISALHQTRPSLTAPFRKRLRQHGAVFWPNYACRTLKPDVRQIFGMDWMVPEVQKEIAFEPGQT